VSGQQRPAAKATRIVRKAEPCAPSASKTATPNEQPTTNQCSSPSDDFSGMLLPTLACTVDPCMHIAWGLSCKVCHAFPAGLLPGMLGILTNVQEKPALGHVAPPSAPIGGTAFPKATHRKLSKVIKVI